MLLPLFSFPGLQPWLCRALLVWLLLLAAWAGSASTAAAATPPATLAEQAALVIGNQAYAFAPLETPRADAGAVASGLRRAGFAVTEAHDLDQSAFYATVDAFFARHAHARVLTFFFAGHGVQLNGRNYLLPTSIDPKNPDILSQLFDLRYLLERLGNTRARFRLVILDACRSNLFSSHPSASSGLSELIAPPGSFIAFSTSPGATAEDGDGLHSPYAQALIEALFEPGLRIESAFKEVRKRVRHSTNQLQTPWESTSLEEDFYLVPEKQRFSLHATPLRPSARPAPDEGPATAHSEANAATVLKSDAKPDVKPDVNPGIKPEPKPLLARQESVVAPSASNPAAAPAPHSCSRLLSKLSLGISPLSANEVAALKSCR